MARIRDLTFRLTGKDAGATRTFRGVGKEADNTRSKISGMGSALAGGALAAGVASFGRASIEAFTEAQAAQDRLTFAFEKFPKTADVNIEALRKYNSALAKKTTFDDDAIASGQAVLAQFGLTGKQIEKVTPLVLDYAASTGQDASSASETLGKALMGNTKALKSIGISYKSTGDAAKDFENIQALVSAKVGGFAEKEGKTAAGQLQILQNQFGEVQEEVGAKLLPALTTLGESLLSTIEFVQRNDEVIKPLVITLGTAAAAVYTVNKAVAIGKATTAAATAVTGLFTRATVLQGSAASAAAAQTNGLATANARVATTGKAAAASTVAVKAGAAAALGPIGLFTLAMYELYKASDTVSRELDEVGRGIKSIFSGNIGSGVKDILGLNDFPGFPGQDVPTAPKAGRRMTKPANLVVNSNLNVDGRTVARVTSSAERTLTRNGATPTYGR